MPELPEVQTTVNGLKRVLPGLSISDVWSDLPKKKHKHKNKETIKDLAYFNEFRNAVKGRKFLSAERRAKNILIHISGDLTILIHLKMTGHLLYGKYKQIGKTWKPAEHGPLEDPFNRFVHVVFSLSNGKHLAFSDTRKFGKVVLIKGDVMQSSHLSHLGPEPLLKNFTLDKFKARLDRKPNQKIKTLLMDQEIISGIGNIYSDEILWHSGVHPEEREKNIPALKFKLMFEAMKKVLKKGIDFGGDSMSDYRNIEGLRGKFQLHHEAYQRAGEKCRKKDGGVIIRKKIGGRSAHFCPVHQKLIKK
jgi:formamidopyrimidine-DNA glycosylase